MLQLYKLVLLSEAERSEKDTLFLRLHHNLRKVYHFSGPEAELGLQSRNSASENIICEKYL